MLKREKIEFASGARFNTHGASAFRQHYGHAARQPSLLARIVAWFLADV